MKTDFKWPVAVGMETGLGNAVAAWAEGGTLSGRADLEAGFSDSEFAGEGSQFRVPNATHCREREDTAASGEWAAGLWFAPPVTVAMPEVLSREIAGDAEMDAVALPSRTSLAAEFPAASGSGMDGCGRTPGRGVLETGEETRPVQSAATEAPGISSIREGMREWSVARETARPAGPLLAGTPVERVGTVPNGSLSGESLVDAEETAASRPAIFSGLSANGAAPVRMESRFGVVEEVATREGGQIPIPNGAAAKAALAASGAMPVEGQPAGGEEAHGTSTAFQPVLMKRAVPMQNFSGSQTQVLPGEPIAAASKAVVPPAKPLPRVDKSESPETLPVATELRAGSPVLEDRSADAPVLRANGAARSLERTHDLMSLHALRLRDSSADSLRVVIRPGPGMQLALDLHLTANGGVEVRALMNRGDYQFLNAHWAELQQQLEPRGVRLAPLTSADTGGESATDFAGSRRQPKPDESKSAEALPGLPFVAAAAAPAKARRPAAARGLELWA